MIVEILAEVFPELEDGDVSTELDARCDNATNCNL
jgi:hypothetical protein